MIYQRSIAKQLQDYLASNDVDRQKTSFWASDSEKSMWELYHQWKGTPITNPMDSSKQLMFLAANMMEASLTDTLKKMGLVKPGDQQRIQMERHGVPISGYIDGVFVDGTPLEVKTMYGRWATKDLKEGKPRTSYLKQLAIYIDALNESRGKLIYLERGTGESFEFTLERVADKKFQCNDITFDLDETYAKWRTLYENNILNDIEPDPSAEYKYKFDLKTVDWKKIPKSKIASARKGLAVIGDWQILYSPYKELWIEKQKTVPGYSPEEQALLMELTKGYTSSKF